MLLINDIYSPLWITIWLNVGCIEVIDLVLQLSAVISWSHLMIWTRIAYHPTIASEPTNQAHKLPPEICLLIYDFFFGFFIFCVVFYLDNVLIYVFHSYDALNSKTLI